MLLASFHEFVAVVSSKQIQVTARILRVTDQMTILSLLLSILTYVSKSYSRRPYVPGLVLLCL
jgi:hypothetical protein